MVVELHSLNGQINILGGVAVQQNLDNHAVHNQWKIVVLAIHVDASFKHIYVKLGGYSQWLGILRYLLLFEDAGALEFLSELLIDLTVHLLLLLKFFVIEHQSLLNEILQECTH